MLLPAMNVILRGQLLALSFSPHLLSDKVLTDVKIRHKAPFPSSYEGDLFSIV